MNVTTMRAAVLQGVDGPTSLRIDDVAIPQPGPGDVLVAVGAFGLNNAESLQIRGVMPPPPGGVPGLECAGTVVRTGAGVQTLNPGDRVAALTRSGSYAEYVVVPASACIVIPDTLELTVAGGFLETAATAWWNLVQRARIRPGERVLVHGAAGGVGSMAVQLARALGAVVIGTARGPDKTALCSELGCDRVLDYGAGDVFDALRAVAPEGVDVILDNQGAATLGANVAALAPLGRLVVVGVASGSEAAVDLGAVMAAGAEISSSSLGRLSDDVRAVICRAVEAEVLPRIDTGELRPVLDQTFGFDEVVTAHRRFGAADRIGKVVVSMPDYISKADATQRNQLFA